MRGAIDSARAGSPLASWILLLAAVLLPGGAGAQERIALRVGGQERQAVIVASPSPAPRPLLIMLHGRFGTGEQLLHSSGMSGGPGFVIVAPDGVQRSWADGRGATPADRAGIDDVAFIRALVAAVGARHRLDAARIYAAGHSNGGFMAARLACEAADLVSGIAIVAATIGEPVAQRCQPARPVSVLLIHGTADPLAPYGGGAVAGGGGALPAEAALRLFAARDRCGPAVMRDLPHPGPADGTSARMIDHTGCVGGARVALISIAGGGHGWPGGTSRLSGRMIGPPTRAVNANVEIIGFFGLRPR